MKKIKENWRLLVGSWRLFFGFCPECNSDAPNLYDCPVCNYYRSSEGGMPDNELRNAWWRKFVEKHKQ